MNDIGGQARTERILGETSAAVGGLSDDEHAVVYGALAAQESFAFGAAQPLPQGTVPVVRDVLLEFREGPCKWCGQPLDDHALDMSGPRVQVRCKEDQESHTANEWLVGPVRLSSLHTILAVFGWVVVPLLSLGMLSWLMPLIGAAVLRRALWGLVGGLSLAGFLAIGIVPEGIALSSLIFANWFGMAIFGGFQIRPWLDGLEERRNAR